MNAVVLDNRRAPLQGFRSIIMVRKPRAALRWPWAIVARRVAADEQGEAPEGRAAKAQGEAGGALAKPVAPREALGMGLTTNGLEALRGRAT